MVLHSDRCCKGRIFSLPHKESSRVLRRESQQYETYSLKLVPLQALYLLRRCELNAAIVERLNFSNVLEYPQQGAMQQIPCWGIVCGDRLRQ